MTQAKTVLAHLAKMEATYFSDHDRYTDNVVLLDFDPVKYPTTYLRNPRQRCEELSGDRNGGRSHGGGLVDHTKGGSGPGGQLRVQMRIRPRNTPPRYGAPRAATQR